MISSELHIHRKECKVNVDGGIMILSTCGQNVFASILVMTSCPIPFIRADGISTLLHADKD